MGEAIVNMVDQLTTPYDREPFMDALRKEVASWFRKHQQEKKGTIQHQDTKFPPGNTQAFPKTVDSSLRSINQALKKGDPKQKIPKKP